MRAITFLGLASAVAATLAAQRSNVSGGVLRPDQACYDVHHYDLSLAVDPDRHTIDGVLTMTADVTEHTDVIGLDLDRALALVSVEVDGERPELARDGDRIALHLPSALEPGARFAVRMAYGGVPRVAPNPPWDGGFTWAKTAKGAPWVATTCQMNGADLWWPCKDHPSDKPAGMDLHVTVPRDLYVAANGRLIADERKGRLRTFHWRVSVPISNYCIALNIAPYVVIERTYVSVTGEKVDAFFFALPESVAKAREAFPHFLDHLRHMEETCGPYPFRAEKYAVVETPHLGMEHQTIIAYGNGFRLGRDGYDWLHHHEMAHEWWANLVTCRDWKDMWIHEGIGTYMQALYRERQQGRQGYLREMYAKLAGIGNREPVAPREVQDSAQIYRGNDIYNKGSWIMHSLRWLMGDEKFFVALRRMAYPDPELEKVRDGSCVRLTDTEEIRAIAEQHHGSDLDWFFEVYLRQPALPRLESERDGRDLVVRWVVPGELPFPMPVPVHVGDEVLRVEIENGEGRVAVPRGAKVELDPDRLILRELPDEPRRRRRR